MIGALDDGMFQFEEEKGAYMGQKGQIDALQGLNGAQLGGIDSPQAISGQFRSDLGFMRQLLIEKRDFLAYSRITYLKPWPEAEDACDRLLAWVEEMLRENS